MRIIDFYGQLKSERLVVGLGYFDSVHKGHMRLVDSVRDMATRLDASPCIFTFSNNPFAMFGKADLNIFPFEERVRRLANVGVELIISVNADRKFVDMTGEEFLTMLYDNFNVVGFVSGQDYTYGAKASGNQDTLKAFAKGHDVDVEIVDLLSSDGKKIASRDIRTMLIGGDIGKVNELLSEPYSITGRVISGRHDGGKIGIPTANINLHDDTLIIRNGVYSTIAIVDGIKYRAVTNVGGHPTFNDDSKNVEAYILDFDKDIYDKEITIIFYRWLRGVKKFASIKELKDTIAYDEIVTRKEIDI